MTRLFNRVHPAGAEPRAIATELNRIIEYLEQQARIYVTTRQVAVPSIPANTWFVLPLSTVDTTPERSAIAMSLANDRISYTGPEPVNIAFDIAYAVDWATNAQVDLGLRKNGDDGTIVPYRVAQNRSEFSSPYVVSCDMTAGDYVELVLFSIVVTIPSAVANGLISARQTGFVVQ